MRAEMRLNNNRNVSSNDGFDILAAWFHCLSEPLRLRILHALEKKEKSVSQLTVELNANQANISKHLKILTGAGILERRPVGIVVYYSVAVPDIFQVCKIARAALAIQLSNQAAGLGSRLFK
jgi:DNA-binding transcriptional ArsR family regulator